MSFNNNQKKPDLSWLPFAIILFAVFGGVPFLLPIGIIILVFNSAAKNNANRNTNTRKYNTRSSDTPSYRNARRSRYTTQQMQQVNDKLRRYFRHNDRLPVLNDINLRLKGTNYSSLSSLNVYKNDDCVCSLNEFGNTYGEMYDQIIKLLVAFSKQEDTDNIFDAQATPTPQEKPVEKPKEEAPKVKTAQDYINEINALNVEIPDKGITDGLYESCALLKQIGVIEERFPDNRPKLDKLYNYYLPILINILNQYKDLQAAKSDASFEDNQTKLKKTIILINDAMKTLTASLCEDDFINLSADMSTLEALLKKDGLAGDGRMSQVANSQGGANNDAK